MKLFVTTAIAAMWTSLAFANTQIAWTTDSIPVEIRARIEQVVSSRCDVYGNGLKEARSSVRVDRVDQGATDFHYSVTLSTRDRIDQVLFEDVDAIRVEAVHYSFTNPTAGDPIRVKATGLSAGRCK